MPPTYVVGDLWDEIDRSNILLVTTNAMTNIHGSLVMGRGAAQEARDRFPGLAQALGQRLIQDNLVGKFYGIIGIRTAAIHPTMTIGAFQVKYHWRHDAHLSIIARSAAHLMQFAMGSARIAMNMPGVGNGRLAAHDVIPLLEPLPPHVFIYTKEPLCS